MDILKKALLPELIHRSRQLKKEKQIDAQLSRLFFFQVNNFMRVCAAFLGSSTLLTVARRRCGLLHKLWSLRSVYRAGSRDTTPREAWYLLLKLARVAGNATGLRAYRLFRNCAHYSINSFFASYKPTYSSSSKHSPQAH